MDEKLTARAKLIYERNNNTPLFLRAADYYLQNNNPHTAISILEIGLKTYPNHPLGYLLLSKAHYLLGDFELTESLLKKTSEILNDNRTYKYYKREFKLPDIRKSPFDSSRGNIFMSTDDDNIPFEDDTDEQPKSVEDNLQQIAEKLVNTRIDKDNITSLNETKQQEYDPDKSKLASETFANIYISQGQKIEAIKVYELLIARNPEKEEYYLEKIRELKS